MTHGIEANTRNGLGTFTRALYDEAKVKGFSAISMRNDLKANFLLGESESKPLSERRVVPDHVSVIEAVGLSPRPYPRCTNTGWIRAVQLALSAGVAALGSSIRANP